jgi:hypothetical protein
MACLLCHGGMLLLESGTVARSSILDYFELLRELLQLSRQRAELGLVFRHEGLLRCNNAHGRSDRAERRQHEQSG